MLSVPCCASCVVRSGLSPFLPLLFFFFVFKSAPADWKLGIKKVLKKVFICKCLKEILASLCLFMLIYLKMFCSIWMYFPTSFVVLIYGINKQCISFHSHSQIAGLALRSPVKMSSSKMPRSRDRLPLSPLCFMYEWVNVSGLLLSCSKVFPGHPEAFLTEV